MNPIRKLLVSLFILAINVNSAQGSDDLVCGPLNIGAFGRPLDFRTEKHSLEIVERAHFTPNVENVITGQTGLIGGDLDYTLRASPNHHRALMSLIRLGEKHKSERPPGLRYSIPCYFNRAIRFVPDDEVVRMIFAIYLVKKGKNKEALDELTYAKDRGADDANFNYNLGLVYLSLGKYDEALIYAHKAYIAGFPLPGLKDKLKRAGKWKEPNQNLGELQPLLPSQ
jgi:hypothetical protein